MLQSRSVIGFCGSVGLRVATQPGKHQCQRHIDEAEVDVLACMNFPREHWANICSGNPLERLTGEVKRRTNVVGIFPNADAITRLVGAILMEQNDEWAVQRTRTMTLETIAPVSDKPVVILSAVAA